MNRREIKLDELLMKVDALLAEDVDDVLEVPSADVAPDLVEVRHDGEARQRLDLLQVGEEYLHGQESDPCRTRDQSERGRERTRGTHLQAGLLVLLEDPFGRFEDDLEVIDAELLQVAYRWADLLLDVVLVLAHPVDGRQSAHSLVRLERQWTHCLRSLTAFSCMSLPLYRSRSSRYFCRGEEKTGSAVPRSRGDRQCANVPTHLGLEEQLLDLLDLAPVLDAAQRPDHDGLGREVGPEERRVDDLSDARELSRLELRRRLVGQGEQVLGACCRPRGRGRRARGREEGGEGLRVLLPPVGEVPDELVDGARTVGGVELELPLVRLCARKTTSARGKDKAEKGRQDAPAACSACSSDVALASRSRSQLRLTPSLLLIVRIDDASSSSAAAAAAAATGPLALLAGLEAEGEPPAWTSRSRSAALRPRSSRSRSSCTCDAAATASLDRPPKTSSRACGSRQSLPEMARGYSATTRAGLRSSEMKASMARL